MIEKDVLVTEHGDMATEAGEKAERQGPRVMSGRAIRHLRALGHHLTPIVQIGKEGLTDAVIAATRESLRAHELVKIRIGTEAPVDRNEAGAELAAEVGGTLVQVLGRTVLVYKRHPHKPKIELPR
ncbi:RNA binding protein [Labilithrix luteola]|uniref:RNA binding protein n=1 Tax=Labilithrix luteola TaxID=1391654 RepID=A0A0K1QAJ8_9BACT|nr:ribosome assembly RNA-binding protein YhbY [Labilithrix luteola]AKV02811.1 RNA binding protein [Labilithrix luteola]